MDKNATVVPTESVAEKFENVGIFEKSWIIKAVFIVALVNSVLLIVGLFGIFATNSILWQNERYGTQEKRYSVGG